MISCRESLIRRKGGGVSLSLGLSILVILNPLADRVHSVKRARIEFLSSNLRAMLGYAVPLRVEISDPLRCFLLPVVLNEFLSG